MRRSGRISASVGFGHHDHLCWVYGAEHYWWAATRSFLVEGAARRDRLVVVSPSPEETRENLTGMPSVDRMLARGQLLLLDLAEWHAALDGTPPWLGTLSTWVDDALSMGLRGVRVVADATDAVLAHALGRPQESELLLDRAVCDLPLTVMCGYDGNRLLPHVGVGLCFAHPLWHGAKGEVEANLFAERGGGWRLTGSLDLMTREQLRDGLSATRSDLGDVELDLSSLEFIDVGGVRELVTLAQDLPRGSSLVLRAAPRGLREILRLGWDGDERIRVVGR